MPTSPGLTIGALSRGVSCKVETIRYYERIGLMPDPPRTGGGHRVYGNADRERLAFIRRGRELGFTLDEIRSLLDLVDGGGEKCADVQAIALKHLRDIRRKITDLKELAGVLEKTAALCEGGATADCPIVYALSRAKP